MSYANSINAEFNENNKNSTQLMDIIDNAIDVLTVASTGAADILLALGHLDPKAAIIMKVLLPVGGILVKEINPKKGSISYEQLLNFHTRSEGIWMANKNEITISTYAIIGKISLEQYYEKVTEQIRIMMDSTNELLNPEIIKSPKIVDAYELSCKIGATSPQQMLGYLRDRMVNYCMIPMNSSDAELIASKRTTLFEASLKLKVKDDTIPDLGDYILEFSPLYDLARENGITKFGYSTFSSEFATYKEAFASLFDEIRESLPSQLRQIKRIDNCILRDFILAINYNNKQVDAFALQLKDEILDILFISSICAKIVYGDHERSIEIYSKNIANSVDNITSHVANWLNESLASSWPSTHFGIVKKQILGSTTDPAQINNQILKLIIDSSIPKLKATGLKNFIHQVVISSQNHDTLVDGHGCSFMENVAYNFNVALSRIAVNRTDKKYQMKLNSRLIKNFLYGNNSVNKTIQNIMPTLYNADYLAKIADALYDNLPEMFSAEHFSCLEIIRSYANFPLTFCPEIIFSKSDYGIGDVLKASPVYSYKYPGGWVTVCEDYRFIYFV